MSEYVRVVSDDEAPPAPPAAPALVTGYEPDRFQKFAIEAIEQGDSVLCLAKTGSGKTFVGEYQIAKSLQRGGRVFYTTPIKSLSNQKFHDLTKLFPQASVGIMTGDIKFRPDAQIIIMTTEILRNLLFKRGTLTENVGATSLVSLEGLDAVIFDEVHYINDPDRGHVWEETLMLMPPEVKLILLSATLSSPTGFARWLADMGSKEGQQGESKKRRVWVISTLWRAVPLEHCVVGYEGGSVKPLTIYDSKEVFHDQTYKAWLSGRSAELLAADKFKDKVKAAKAGGVEGGIEGKVRPRAFEHKMNELLDFLHTRGNLPAIFFVFSRVGCEKLAAKVAGNFLDSSDASTVAHIWDFHLSRYRATMEKSPQFYKLRELAMRGIAFHHSGLVPFLKEILEILFSKGYIKLLFATETFAVGINMPTKTVVFTALDKYSESGIRQLRSAEYIQMAGRAGRRGKDDRGLVIYLPQREPAELVDVRQMLTGRAASFGSRMTFGYDFVLKVMNQTPSSGAPEGGEESIAEPWKELIERSYWAQLAKDEIAALQKESDAASLRKDDLWRSLESVESEACEELERLEEEVRTLTNAKKKRAQRELVAWHEEHRESVWKPILARYKAHKESSVEADRAVERLLDAVDASMCPQIRLRYRVLEEFGYVEKSGHLSAVGRLASEVNEGHPFLMTEMFQRLRGKAAEWPLADLLTLLSLFLGELSDSEDVDKNKHPKDLNVSAKVRDELLRIGDDAQVGCKRESGVGLRPDPKFWGLSTEWVEPVAWWVSADKPILPQLAVECDIFEGNLQRALMKLMGLVEEWKAMATLAAETEWLAVLEGAQELVLRDIVVAESLYLRL